MKNKLILSCLVAILLAVKSFAQGIQSLISPGTSIDQISFSLTYGESDEATGETIYIYEDEFMSAPGVPLLYYFVTIKDGTVTESGMAFDPKYGLRMKGMLQYSMGDPMDINQLYSWEAYGVSWFLGYEKPETPVAVLFIRKK